MKTGGMVRNGKSEKAYGEAGKTIIGCPFCNVLGQKTIQSSSKAGHFFIIKNIYKYDVWDNRQVSEHLLLIPKRHIDGLSALTKAEFADYNSELVKADREGYEVFTRPSGGETKTVDHLHTHLIKIGPEVITWLLYIRKPHILLSGHFKT